MSLMRAPAELGRLRALTEEPVDRPGVDELARRFRYRGNLIIALGDVDGFNPETLGELTPAGAIDRHRGGWVGLAGEIDERLLDEVRHEPGIGAVGNDRGGAGG